MGVLEATDDVTVSAEITLTRIGILAIINAIITRNGVIEKRRLIAVLTL